MRRLISLSLLICAMLVAVAPTFAASHTPPSGSTGASNGIWGVVPPRGTQVARPDAVTNLSYHGGPVMHTNKTYAIYWVPSGFTLSATYQSLINGFFANVAAAAGSTSNVYYSTTQYSGILNGSTFGGSYVDTAAYPASGCTDTVAATTVCLSDAQLQAEIQRVITLKGWPKGQTNMFFMFTAKNVGSCYSAGQCAFTTFCAYHSNIGTGSTTEIIYANQPYVMTVPANCDAGQHPNGNDADGTLNVVSHEHAEAITDPNGNAWWDSTTGEENGDKCAWNFGASLGNTGLGLYNQVIGTGKYYLQQEWSNSTSRCVLTGW